MFIVTRGSVNGLYDVVSTHNTRDAAQAFADTLNTRYAHLRAYVVNV